MGLHAILVDEFDDQLLVRRLGLDEKRDISGEGVDMLEFDMLGPQTGFCSALFKCCRVREEARMGLIADQSGDIRILLDLTIVLIQCCHSEA